MDPSIPWADQEPISHVDIPNDINDRYSAFFSSPYKGVDPQTRKLKSSFLQGQLDARPSDAAFNPNYVMMLSPMVRYSKMPFRMLCRRYGADLAFTPMMVAKDIHRGSFITEREESYAAYDEWEHYSGFLSGLEGIHDEKEELTKVWRLKTGDDCLHPMPEFTTCAADRPLIAQLAVNDDTVIPDVAALLDEYVDGFDINCGCPQDWVLKEGIGASQSKNPELVERLLKSLRQSSSKPRSIKIRLRPNQQETVELVRRAEAMGVEWVTVHGRTRNEYTKAPVRDDAVELLRAVSGCSIVLNGDITRPEHQTRVGACDGVQLARGALANPRIFAGQTYTSVQSMLDYLSFAHRYGGSFATHLHHVSYMAHDCLNKGDRLLMARMACSADLYQFLTTKLLGSMSTDPFLEYKYASEYSSQQRQFFKTNLEDIPPYSSLAFNCMSTSKREYTNADDVVLE